MYFELKPLEALRHAELPQVAAPWYALTWLKNAQSGFCRVGGFNDAWEACIHELDPHRDHWNHRAHGFEHLCAKIKQGDWVVVLDKSWPPLAPAYAEVNGHWEPTQHISEPGARERLETRLNTLQHAATRCNTLQHEQREAEILLSQNRPATPKEIEPASGPGTRVGTLGPHVGTMEQANVSNGTAGSIPLTNPGFPAAGRLDNCVNCAIATDATFAGRPTSALPQFDPRGVPISEIPKALGVNRSFARVNGLDDVSSTFSGFGPGARGIVFGDRGPGRAGHVFNVVVDQRGAVKFWDGQSMTKPVIEGQGYKTFGWIRSD